MMARLLLVALITCIGCEDSSTDTNPMMDDGSADGGEDSATTIDDPDTDDSHTAADGTSGDGTSGDETGDTEEPDPDQADVDEPDVGEPDVDAPDVAAPDVGDPDADDPDTDESDAEPSNGSMPVDLPEPTAECPEFVGGDVNFLDHPVRLWVDPEAAELGGGPLVFYWHAAGTAPGEATINIPGLIEEVTAQGGVVAVPYRVACEECTSSSGLPWWYLEDMAVADEVVACAIQQLDIDPSRIHISGTSAGGIHTAAMLYLRSNYIASVATYSGGIGPDTEIDMLDPTNQIPALILHGGDMDFLKDMSIAFQDDLTARDHYTAICEHTAGHGIAPALEDTVWTFFEDHPYGATRTWADAPPTDIYEGCAP